jgi:hypothetical protein
MAAKKTGKTTGKTRLVPWGCPNQSPPYSLWALVHLIETDLAFGHFFFAQLKLALANNAAAIACVDSYLAPTTLELQDLGIPASQIEGMRRCTDSGLLILVIAKQNS